MVDRYDTPAREGSDAADACREVEHLARVDVRHERVAESVGAPHHDGEAARAVTVDVVGARALPAPGGPRQAVGTEDEERDGVQAHAVDEGRRGAGAMASTRSTRPTRRAGAGRWGKRWSASVSSASTAWSWSIGFIARSPAAGAAAPRAPGRAATSPSRRDTRAPPPSPPRSGPPDPAAPPCAPPPRGSSAPPRSPRPRPCAAGPARGRRAATPRSPPRPRRRPRSPRGWRAAGGRG